MNIPLVDLHAQHEVVAEGIRAGWDHVLARGDFISGQAVRDFEHAYAKFSGVPHCVGVASGTDALELALRAVGIGAGHEVIVPVNSFIASAAAVRRTGARPRFVDVDDDTLLIDVEAVNTELEGGPVKAVMPVHLFGQMAPVSSLQKPAADAGIDLVEDAAQAQGARREGVPAGAVGAVAATSFYPGKNLGAYGDAGAVLTTSEGIATRVRSLGDHGSRAKYEHPTLGFNSRLDTLQAVVLSAKLPHLAAWNGARGAAAAYYDELFATSDLSTELRLPVTAPDAQHVWHLYAVRIRERDRILEGLRARGIGAGIHYPVPLHLTGAMADLGYGRGDFPVAEAAAEQLLSLPLFPHITREQQQRVVEALEEVLS